MAKSVNKVILLGNVGKDPEIRALPSGTKVASWTLATSERFKDSSGNWQERTEWHNLVAYARLAEVVEKFVTKGGKLYIEGKIETHSWNDTRSGEKKYQTQIKVEDLLLLNAQPNSEPTHAEAQPQRQTQARTATMAQVDDWDDFR
jgi:single-strand DNA-binding protein